MKFQNFTSWIAFFRPKCLLRSTKWRKPKKFQLKWPFEGYWVGNFLPFGGEPWWVRSWDWDWARRHLWVERVGRLGWLCRWLVVLLLLLFWLRHADMKDLIREEKDRERELTYSWLLRKQKTRPSPLSGPSLCLSSLSRRIFFFPLRFTLLLLPFILFNVVNETHFHPFLNKEK